VNVPCLNLSCVFRRRRFSTDATPPLFPKLRQNIKESFRLERGDQTGYRAWLSGIALASYSVARRSDLKGKTLLELGSGTGVVGITAAINSRDCDVVLTDRKVPVRIASLRSDGEMELISTGGADGGGLDLLRKNLEENFRIHEDRLSGCGTIASVRELAWNDEEQIAAFQAHHSPPDIFILSELMYDREAAIGALWPTVKALLNEVEKGSGKEKEKEKEKEKGTEIWISNQLRFRSVAEEFISLAVEESNFSFSVEKIAEPVFERFINRRELKDLCEQMRDEPNSDQVCDVTVLFSNVSHINP